MKEVIIIKISDNWRDCLIGGYYASESLGSRSTGIVEREDQNHQEKEGQ